MLKQDERYSSEDTINPKKMVALLPMAQFFALVYQSLRFSRLNKDGRA